MNRRQLILLFTALIFIGGGAGALVQLKSRQKLGEPGVTTRPLPDSQNVEVTLPEKVQDFTSEFVPTPKLVTDVLPADTCFGSRRYVAPDGFQVIGNVVLMGSDRTSLHKPQFCLQGDGWQLAETTRTNILVGQPRLYQLPVTRINVTRQQKVNNQLTTVNGVYVYWYVSDTEISGDPSGRERMWSMAKQVLATGVIQRWAYVSFLAVCPPGQEDSAYARLSEFISEAVPGFQLTTPAEKEIAVRAK